MAFEVTSCLESYERRERVMSGKFGYPSGPFDVRCSAARPRRGESETVPVLAISYSGRGSARLVQTRTSSPRFLMEVSAASSIFTTRNPA
jgi:hypothetical protein